MKYALLLLICSIQFIALSQPGEDERILEIRKEYKTIRAALSSYNKQSVDFFDESTEGAEVSAYKEDGTTRLLAITWYGETGNRKREYYYKDHQIFFVFDVEERYNRPIYYDEEMVEEMGMENDEPFDPEKSTFIENRYYFFDNELIRWINPEKQYVDVSTQESIIHGQQLIIDSQAYYMKLLEH